MGDFLRRRSMMGLQEVAPAYPFISDFPEFTDFGIYYLTVLELTGSSFNTFISSGTTNYQWAAGHASMKVGDVHRLEITSENIKEYDGASETKAHITKAFTGFPVRLKYCAGGTNNPPTVLLNVDTVID